MKEINIMVSGILTKDLFERLKIIIEEEDTKLMYVHYYIEGKLQSTYEWVRFISDRLKEVTNSSIGGYYGYTFFNSQYKTEDDKIIWDQVYILDNGEICFSDAVSKQTHSGYIYITVPNVYGTIFSDLLSSADVLPSVFHGDIRVTFPLKKKKKVIVNLTSNKL